MCTNTVAATMVVPTPSPFVSQSDSSQLLIKIFDKYLSLWVLLCMLIGTLIGNQWPEVAKYLDRAVYAHISIPVAVLLWMMILPMTLKVELASLKYIVFHPKGVIVATTINWAVQPFLMYFHPCLSLFFLFLTYIHLLSLANSIMFYVGPLTTKQVFLRVVVFQDGIQPPHRRGQGVYGRRGHLRRQPMYLITTITITSISSPLFVICGSI